MVFLAGLVAAACLGLGWVLQQRVAAHAALSDLLSFRLVLHLMRKPVWWLGIGAMTAGSVLGGWALGLGSVALVEPLLSANLLFAFGFAALLKRARIAPPEVVGAILLSAALGVFIAVGDPHAARRPHPSMSSVALAVVLVAAAVAVLVVLARGRRLAVESVLIATGAGLMYGLQDVATRACLVTVEHLGVARLLALPWPYIVVAAATVGLSLSQNAFRAARLDCSLPPTVAVEPVVGIALGVSLLGDHLSVSPVGLAVEAGCAAAMVFGVVLIGRSGSLAHVPLHLHRHAPADRGTGRR